MINHIRKLPTGRDGVRYLKFLRVNASWVAILLTAFIPWMTAGQVTGQDITPEEFASLLGMQDIEAVSEESVATSSGYVGGRKDVEVPSTLVPGSTDTLRTVGFENYDSVDPVTLQLADLQSQLSAQHMEIGQLRSQLNSPLHFKGRKSPRYFATYESVIVQAVQSNTSALIVETNDGYSQVMFPWKLKHSPRVEFGVMPAAGKLGYRMRYWQFDHSTSFHAGDANGIIPVGTWGTVGYLAEDGDIVTGVDLVEEGDFRSTVRADVIDMEVQRSLSLPIEIFAGLRYARIKQGYLARTNEALLGTPDTVAAQTEFRGIGPTVAMRFNHQLPLNRLSLFADARGALLFGNQEYSVVDSANDLLQTMNAIGVQDWSDLSNSMATSAELKFGIQYVPADWLAMRVAMEAQHFGGIGGANPVAVFAGSDNGLSTDGPLDDDLSFFGLSVAVEAGF
ncbi:Lpg1974 family pore-forming outer membrane protein [Rhodopirellula sp. SWK7]|uniref:Lpg1974 family pore-forming outer membrane protein n=1 Tax=Rhodopirellula sp. SWK7 TaxID=595460 RepID=UPI001F3D2133|nr:Lpg1974 family pore-forming outer membrane protein [Rhodopirellula sp. SWK7]